MKTDTMRLEPVDGMTAESWNEAIAPFDTAMFYHHAAWLGFLEEAGRGKLVRYRIVDAGQTAGYFAAFLVRKGPFRILGSPLSASMSEYMGPIVNTGFDVERFLVAIDALCREHRVHHLETGSPLFTPRQMAAHRYETSQWMTFRIPLQRDEEAMWNHLKSKGRNRIRKGIANGLVAEDSNDPAFVDEHYAQVTEIFRCQGLAPPFVIDDFRRLVANLRPFDLVFTIAVKRQDTGEVVASGIFPHDGRRVYSLSTASWLKSRGLYPNELLHWSVMKLAGQRGLTQYSIGDNYRTPDSGGKFKDKFNGDYEPVHRFMRNYSVLAKYSRQLYATLNRVRQRVTAGR